MKYYKISLNINEEYHGFIVIKTVDDVNKIDNVISIGDSKFHVGNIGYFDDIVKEISQNEALLLTEYEL